MKKLFVSIPMNGRTEEEIKISINKMHKIAEVFEGCELALIDTFITEEPPANCNAGVWYLAKSLELLAEADVFIGIEEIWDWRGCYIENQTAEDYGIKKYKVRADIVIDNYQALEKAVYPKAN